MSDDQKELTAETLLEAFEEAEAAGRVIAASGAFTHWVASNGAMLPVGEDVTEDYLEQEAARTGDTVEGIHAAFAAHGLSIKVRRKHDNDNR